MYSLKDVLAVSSNGAEYNQLNKVCVTLSEAAKSLEKQATGCLTCLQHGCLC